MKYHGFKSFSWGVISTLVEGFKHVTKLCFLFAISASSVASSQQFASTPVVPISGSLKVLNESFTGMAKFKVAIVDVDGLRLWSSDGAPDNGILEPVESFDLEVLSGKYNVYLGRSPTSSIPVEVYQSTKSLFFRIWIDAGFGFEQLQPIPYYAPLRAINALRFGGLSPQSYLTKDSYIPIDNSNLVGKITSGNLTAFTDNTNTFTFGNEDAVTNKSIVALSNGGSTPTLRFNVTTNNWEYSNNGTSYFNMGVSSGFEGGGSTSAVDLNSNEVAGVLPVSKGGTGGSAAATARISLGLEIGVDVASFIKNNFTGTIAPVLTDDSSAGYSVGSLWFDTVAEQSYIALSVTPGSAIWRSLTLIGTVGLEDGSVTTAKITDGAVTTAKIADDNVTTAKIADGNVTSGKIATGAVGATELASTAVTPGAYAYASISVDADGRITSASANTPSSGDITSIGNVTSGDAFTEGDTVGTELVYEGVTDDAFENRLQFTGDPTADTIVTVPNVTGTLVTTGDTGTVSAGMIANNAVTTAKIADDNVTTAKIADGNVTSGKIASNGLDFSSLSNSMTLDASTSINAGSALNLSLGANVTLDLGSAGGLQIPSGTAPTVNTVGELALDTTDNTLIMFDGTAPRVIGHDIHQVVVTITADADWDGESIPIWQAPLDMAVTILQVSASVVGSSTPSLTYNIEERAFGSLGSAGTDIYATDEAADDNGEDEVTFTNSSIAAKAHLVFTTGVTAESGTVDYVTFVIYYRKNVE